MTAAHEPAIRTEGQIIGLLCCVLVNTVDRAAKLLVFSDKPILEIALTAGYESQQCFTDSFRAMYKRPLTSIERKKHFTRYS